MLVLRLNDGTTRWAMNKALKKEELQTTHYSYNVNGYK
jgi:hypothetical protein